ncbi:hypothetical protein GOQ30_16815 [Flavobacterium sp. TP390]|uniref:Uncharacterized protein n=1 Tax=Flavobacterium profundi TaxID=1774945 RepID=A0A6I4IVK4_9FLAO|nr:DUF6588 family protein [Flavobacterium profundi]MVO10835.1 hypothetical protein [Flavobacterium profundi]
MKNTIVCLIISLFCTKIAAQTSSDLQQIGYLLTDALFYSEKYIIPITDAAVYQSSSGWILSAKKKEKWDFNIGIHSNIFFVPKKDRDFQIKNSDFQFFQIEGATTATVPTALGNNDKQYLVGELGGEEVRFTTPGGVNQETIIYPYFQASLALPYGFELLGRYSLKTQLKKGNYQVYGAGLKYAISQHFKNWETKNIHLAVAGIYSNADVSFDFLDVNTAYGNLGINRMNGIVDTWHFNFLFSKAFDKFDLNASGILNYSTFLYKVNGPKGSIENVIAVQETINTLLTRIEKDKINAIMEISGVYYIHKLALQSSFAFGKFANLNIGVQYQF